MGSTLHMEAPLRLHANTAADLMIANPISMRAEATIPEAMALFTEKRISAAPVIDESGRPIGVISRSDLLVHQYEHEKAHGRGNYFTAPSFEPGDPLESTATVADVMTPAVFAVSPDTLVSRVIKDMLGLHVHRLFVVDEDGILVGVITTMDVLQQLRAED